MKDNKLTLTMLVKKVEVKTLVTGDKSGRITFETLSPEDVEKLGDMSEWTEAKLTVEKIS